MSKIVDEMLYLSSTKVLIAESIEYKNVLFEGNETFREYISKINDIKVPSIVYKEISQNGEYDGNDNEVYSPISVNVKNYLIGAAETSATAKDDIKARDVVFFEEEYGEWEDVTSSDHHIVPTSHCVISSNGRYIYTIGYAINSNQINFNGIYKYDTTNSQWQSEIFALEGESDNSTDNRVLLQDGDIGVYFDRITLGSNGSSGWIYRFRILVFNLLSGEILHNKEYIPREEFEIYPNSIEYVQVFSNYIYFSKGIRFNRYTEEFEILDVNHATLSSGIWNDHQGYYLDYFITVTPGIYFQIFTPETYSGSSKRSLVFITHKNGYRKAVKTITESISSSNHTDLTLVDNILYFDCFRYCYNLETDTTEFLGNSRFPVSIPDDFEISIRLNHSKTDVLICSHDYNRTESGKCFIFNCFNRKTTFICDFAYYDDEKFKRFYPVAFSPKYIVCGAKIFMSKGGGRFAQKVDHEFYELVSNPYSNPKEKTYYELVAEEKYTGIDEPSGNPKQNEYYEHKGKNYTLSNDTEVQENKKYYALEKTEKYIRTEDETITQGKNYYRKVIDEERPNDRLHKTIGFAKNDVSKGEEGRFYLVFS